MSYYFDDESALEELLNQQLNRAKKVSDPNAIRKTQSGSQVIPVASQPLAGARPSTRDRSKQELGFGETGGTLRVTEEPVNRLANWLDGSSKKVQSTLSDSGAGQSLAAIDNIQDLEGDVIGDLAIVNDGESLEHSLREEKLQEMSKQRLIKLILGQIVPAMNGLKQTGSKKLRSEVERLKLDLRMAHECLEEAQKYRGEELQLAESRWNSLIGRLEDKLKRCEQELDARQKLHKEMLEELDREHSMKLKELEESYRLRLDEEHQRCEATLKRRDEHYALEMKSKLRIGLEVERVDDLFGQVSRSIEGSASDLDMELKLLKEIIEKQKSAVVESNKEHE